MYSYEHVQYLKKIRRNNFWIKFTQIIIIIILLLLWQLLADKNIINTFIFSSPRIVFNTIIKLYQANNLVNHIYTTVIETLISFLLGVIIGILIATILWWNNFVAKVLDPYITILNSLPKVALGPILIIWAGANMKSIILMALLISVFVTIINVYQGFVNTDKNRLKLFQSLKASKVQTYFKLILPNSFDVIVSSLKISVSMSLVGVIMGELLVSKEGLGYLIMYGSQVFNLNLIISSIIILCIVATIMYYFVMWIEKKLIKND
jgi:NitT/TauT family transport system permease protein